MKGKCLDSGIPTHTCRQTVDFGGILKHPVLTPVCNLTNSILFLTFKIILVFLIEISSILYINNLNRLSPVYCGFFLTFLQNLQRQYLPGQQCPNVSIQLLLVSKERSIPLLLLLLTIYRAFLLIISAPLFSCNTSE